MAFDLTRRKALRGMLNGTAVAVGVPLLDIFLDGKGEALAATGVNIEAMYLLHSSEDGLHFAVVVDDHEQAHPQLASA